MVNPGIKINVDYVKTPQGVLKILQIILLLLAFSLIANCCDGGNHIDFWQYCLFVTKDVKTFPLDVDLTGYPRNTAFFSAVTVLGWLLVVFYFSLFFLKFHERFSQIKWEMMVMVTSIVWSVLLLLCCSLLGSTSNTANSVKTTVTTRYLVANNRADIFKKWLNTMIAGVVFGFFSFIAFVVDAILLFKKYWTERKPSNDPAVTKVSEAPGPSPTQPQIPPEQTLRPPPGQMAPNLPGQIVPNFSGQSVQMWQVA